MSKIDLTDYNAVMSTMLKGNGFNAGLIGKSIALLSSATAKVDARAHATAMAVLYCSLPAEMGGSRDCSKAVALVEALGKGGRANAMIAWFHAHSNVRFIAKKGQPLAVKMVSEKTPKLYRELTPADVENARLSPYWVKPAVEGTAKFVTDETFITRLSSLIAACEKEGAELSNPDNVVVLEAVRRRVEAAKAAKATAIHAAATAKFVAATGTQPVAANG